VRVRLLGLGVIGDFVVRSLVGWIDKVRSVNSRFGAIFAPILVIYLLKTYIMSNHEF
jgi:hypothetical protein